MFAIISFFLLFISFYWFLVGLSCVVAKWEARVDGLNQHRSIIYTGTPDFFFETLFCVSTKQRRSTFCITKLQLSGINSSKAPNRGGYRHLK